MFKRSLSPLIATILLIVVSVILITVLLTWGSDFAKEKLSIAQTSTIQSTDFTGLITNRSLSSQNILVSNNHSSKDLTITGYKIISSIDHYLYDYFENKIYYLEEPLLIRSKQAEVLQIDCYPQDSFFIDLLTDQNTYVRTQVLAGSINDINPLSCGLVGHWPLDGDAKDSSRFRNHGVITGATATQGVINEAFSFRGGTSDHINLGNSPVFDIAGPMSVSLWVKYEPHVETSLYDYIFGRPPPSSGWGEDNFTLIRTYGHPNQLYFYIQDEELRTGSLSYYPPLEEWVFLVALYDGANIKLYANGELKINLPTEITKLRDMSGVDLVIGGNKSATSRTFNGSIDDLRIYNRALFPFEIEDLNRSI